MTTDEKKRKHANLKSDSCDEEMIKNASLVASFELAEASKSFDEGEFLKNLMLKIRNCFGKKRRRNGEFGYSNFTIAKNGYKKFITTESVIKINSSDSFSIAIDESTDVMNTSQLLIYGRSVDVNCVASEQLLHCIPLHGRMRGIDVYENLENVLQTIGINQGMTFSIYTYHSIRNLAHFLNIAINSHHRT